MNSRLMAVALALCWWWGADPAEADTVRVTTTAQQAAPGEGCTITDAIVTTQLDVAFGDCTIVEGGTGYRIEIPAGTYLVTTPFGGPDLVFGATAFPVITRPITIEGAGADTIIMRDPAAPAFRFFRVQSGLDIRRLTLSGGDAGNNCCGGRHKGGAILGDDGPAVCGPLDLPGSCHVQIVVREVLFENNTAGNGGAISDYDFYYGVGVEVTTEDSIFRSNSATWGGAISVAPSGLLHVTRSRFEDNIGTEYGGAVYAAPSAGVQVDVTDSEFLHNHATNQYGGAISAWHLALTRVTMRGNTAAVTGGAVDISDGTATIVDSTFDSNSSQRGGAVKVMGRLTVSGSTFTNNVASHSDGGGVYLYDRAGESRIVNSTFSANHAFVEGTAISVQSGGLTLVNDTIVGNTTIGSWGPAVRGHSWNLPTLRVSNSIIAGNSSEGFAFDVAATGELVSLGHNLIGSDLETRGAFSQPGDLKGTAESPLDPGLLVLAANGGPTDTHGLSPTSLALDGGSSVLPGTDEACLAVDQRGVHRPGAGTQACDIGAFEHVITVPLTLHVGAGGSVVGLNGSTACAGGQCVGTFDSGTTVKLEATTAAGFAFVGWLGGGCVGLSPLCFVTMDGAQEVTATFRAESAPTTTVLTSSANPVLNGQDVTLTAVVTANEPAAGVPTGSVTFLNVTEGTTIGTAPLIAGTATLTRTPRWSAFVVNEIMAVYTGDGSFTASSDTIEQVINTATTLVVSSSANPVVSGQPLTITATVSATDSARMPTGSVTFEDTTANVSLGSGTLDASGAASITPTLPVGNHTIVANYAGDEFVGGSSGSVSQEILVTTVNLEVREDIVVSDTVSFLPSQMLSIVESIVVADAIALLPSAMLNINESVIVADSVVLVPPANTPAGSLVSFVSGGVTLVYASVTNGGMTTVTATNPTDAPPPPMAFDHTVPPAIFEITTTAVFSGSISVCLTYPAGSISPRAMHFEGGAWIDRTTSTNPATREVCASVASLSPFAVFVPRAAEGRMIGDGALPGGHEFDFRVAERSMGKERGALSYQHRTPKSGKVKARTDEFRATSIGAITFWDDPAYRPSRKPKPSVDSVVFSGTGKWNGMAGYSFEVETSDEGEPGRGHDTFTIVIRSPQGAVVAASEGVLAAGNIQSQRLRKR